MSFMLIVSHLLEAESHKSSVLAVQHALCNNERDYDMIHYKIFVSCFICHPEIYQELYDITFFT